MSKTIAKAPDSLTFFDDTSTVQLRAYPILSRRFLHFFSWISFAAVRLRVDYAWPTARTRDPVILSFIRDSSYEPRNKRLTEESYILGRARN